METIWVLVVIITGSGAAGPSSMPGLISGDAYTRTTLYFETEEACNVARDVTIDAKERMTQQFDIATVDISDCTTLVVENKTR